MYTNVIFGVLGGLGLFLFGMRIMSEGLQKIAGKSLRRILELLTKNVVTGVLVGAGVTAIIQSSSATTVMLIGFVEAGLLNLIQAIGIVIGANIGTTITAQIIAFKISRYALPAIGIGVFLYFFIPKKNWKYWGQWKDSRTVRKNKDFSARCKIQGECKPFGRIARFGGGKQV